MAIGRATALTTNKDVESALSIALAWVLSAAGAWSALRAIAFSDGLELLSFGALAFACGLLKLRLQNTARAEASSLPASVPVVVAAMPFLGPAASMPAMLAALAETATTDGPDRETLPKTLFRLMKGPAAAMAGGTAYVLVAGRCASGAFRVDFPAFVGALAAYTAVDMIGRFLAADRNRQLSSIFLSTGATAAAGWLICVWREFCPARLLLYMAAAIGAVWAASELTHRKKAIELPSENDADDITQTSTVAPSLTLVDTLTGLANDRYLYIFLQQEIGRNVRKNLPVSLLLLDVDDFETVNDSYGCDAGDAAMMEIGRLLKTCVREYDIIARYSSDEFAVVLPEAKSSDAYARAERIREEIASHIFEGGFGVRVSVGVATYPEHGMTPDDLISSAHHALNRAKFGGKNRVTSCMDVAERRLYGT